ncbi:helix-turn-helix domain-containing protein [Kordia sp.]|uniref:helix-turn-helix domain-containing protein n=1 Tax=Kordia sp. TaxID=1965332 RepID=UPI003D6A803F
MKKLLPFFCFFSVILCCYAQKSDALLEEGIALKKKVLHKKVAIDKAETLIRYYLKKAQESQRKELIGRAYYLLSVKNTDHQKKMLYIDSTLFYTKDLKTDKEFPMKGYFYKGLFLDMAEDYQRAIDNYLFAESYANTNQDKTYQYYIKYNIAFLKRRIGNYEEAIKLFKECIVYEEAKKEMNMSSYLNILLHLTAIYYETGQLEKSSIINQQGIQLALENKLMDLYYRFIVCSGINLSLKGSYKAAVDSLEKGIPYLDKSNKITSSFYLAKSYDALQEREKALSLFKKIDTAFTETQNLFLPIRESYLYLIKDSKEKKDKELQLYYIEQLLKADSISHTNYKYLSTTITKKYDIPELMESRDHLIADLKSDKNLILIISIILVVLTLGGLVYYYTLKKVYKKRYDAIVNRPSAIIEEEIIVENAQIRPIAIDIDERTIQEILKQLAVFEEEKHYLTNQISLKDVAKIVNTNSKYLSKIINSHKGKNFATYINDLRIDYMITRIQHDPLYLKYTIRAIAAEAGFSNQEGFLRAFRKRTGLNPSYFIKKVRESQ